MRNQRGMSLIGLLLSGVALAAAFLLGMKTVPAFSEYAAVKKAITAIATSVDPGNVTVTEIRRDFDRRAAVDDISSIRGSDLDVTKRGGQVEISVAYQRTVPVIANVSLLFDFRASTSN